MEEFCTLYVNCPLSCQDIYRWVIFTFEYRCVSKHVLTRIVRINIIGFVQIGDHLPICYPYGYITLQWAIIYVRTIYVTELLRSSFVTNYFLPCVFDEWHTQVNILYRSFSYFCIYLCLCSKCQRTSLLICTSKWCFIRLLYKNPTSWTRFWINTTTTILIYLKDF